MSLTDEILENVKQHGLDLSILKAEMLVAEMKGKLMLTKDEEAPSKTSGKKSCISANDYNATLKLNGCTIHLLLA